MSTQNLRLMRAFVALDGIRGRLEHRQLPAILRGCGYYTGDPDEVEELYFNDSLRVLRLHRNSKRRRGETESEFVNLFETMPDGSKRHYFKMCGQLTVDEAALHIHYWEKKLREDMRHFSRYRKFHVERLGQPLLDLLERDEGEDEGNADGAVA